MGDQVGEAVSGTLYYVPYSEFERVLGFQVSAVAKTELFASLCRINTLYMIARAGSGHIGSSFSSLDIMSWLELNELRRPSGDSNQPHDIFFSSKGHDAPGLYSTWIGTGRLEFDQIHSLRRLNGLPGHPDVATPNVVTNTGSLGMGISKAKGIIFANRLRKQEANVFVLTGDGELQEGQFWESLISAANSKLSELMVIIDHNKLQSDTLVSKVSDLGDLEAKLRAFDWHVSRCDGNDLAAFSACLEASKRATDKPKVIIADTIKGKGVSFMEHTAIDSDVEFYKFHSGAPSEDAYARAAQELIYSANAMLATHGADSLVLERVERPAAVLPKSPQKLVQAYSSALVEQARKHPHLVALDADLILDTGLIPFQKEFSDRFFECGIAEQDMVSQAGGMALQGLLPIVHSFACFLSARPNEHIYNNATEGTKIIYVGSLAGVVPAGPGHSHQAIRDISSLAAIPDLVLMEPSCEAEVGLLLDWAINHNPRSSYLRMVSIPVEIPYSLPIGTTPILGWGTCLREGNDAVLISAGPVTLAAAWHAAKLLEGQGIQLRIINMPWLNYVDDAWLREATRDMESVYCLDNHYVVGGLADTLRRCFDANGTKRPRIVSIGIQNVPPSGMNGEVLDTLGMSPGQLAQRIAADIG